MNGKTELYDAFGEMVYLIAKSDGTIQEEEIQAFEQKIEGHPWAKEIKWSFDYEAKKDNPLDELYKKVISICHDLGPQAEYAFLTEVMEEVAAASNGIDNDEQSKMNNFTNDLVTKFKADIADIKSV